MKLRYLMFIFILIFVSGCTISSKSIEQERKDIIDMISANLKNTTKIVILKEDEKGKFQSLSKSNNSKYSIHKEIEDKNNIEEILQYFEEMYIYDVLVDSTTSKVDMIMWFYNKNGEILFEYNGHGFIKEKKFYSITFPLHKIFIDKYFTITDS